MIFGQGTKKGDEPTYAILMTYIVAQVTMLCDLNQIASFTTMTYLVSTCAHSQRTRFRGVNLCR
jgi:potassium/chloride transporter 9